MSYMSRLSNINVPTENESEGTKMRKESNENGKKVKFTAVLKIDSKSIPKYLSSLGRLIIMTLAIASMLISSHSRLFNIEEKPADDISQGYDDGDGGIIYPSKDELDSGADELPDQYKDLMYEGEYPLALGIYDVIFGDDSPITPDGELKIVGTDLSKNPVPENVLIKDNTNLGIKSSDFLTLTSETVLEEKELSDEPLVLIYHTHGTEGYAEEGKNSYAPSSLPRPRDITKNVVAVGKVLADYLNSRGIPTLHCEIMHDDGTYNIAYSKSANTIKEYLKKYPSIKYAFDIHRDALLNDTTLYKTVTYDESTPVAQLMLVMGTNVNVKDHDGWKRCMSFAVNTQYLLTKRLNNIVRPISTKKSAYNQQYPYIGMLIEVGTCANTMNEAKASALILGEALATMILCDVALVT